MSNKSDRALQAYNRAIKRLEGSNLTPLFGYSDFQGTNHKYPVLCNQCGKKFLLDISGAYVFKCSCQLFKERSIRVKEGLYESYKIKLKDLGLSYAITRTQFIEYQNSHIPLVCNTCGTLSHQVLSKVHSCTKCKKRYRTFFQ